MPSYKNTYPLPAVTYRTAMHLYLDGVPLGLCNPSLFAEAIERLVAQAPNQGALHAALDGHDYRYRTDVWHALLVLEQHGIRFDHVFIAPPE